MTLLFCDIRLLPHCSRPIKKLLVGPDLFSGPSSSEQVAKQKYSEAQVVPPWCQFSD